MRRLDDAYQQVEHFKGNSLKTRISRLQNSLERTDRHGCEGIIVGNRVVPSLFESALLLKRASAQIDEVVHAVGILIALPFILNEGEFIQSVSLAAGNTGRPFDLETNLRVAEFKFIDWKGGSESIRQNQLFKDFYELAEMNTTKKKCLYVLGLEYPLKFLTSNRALKSVMSRGNKLWSEFNARYGDEFQVVGDYYRYRKTEVDLIDLSAVVTYFRGGTIASMGDKQASLPVVNERSHLVKRTPMPKYGLHVNHVKDKARIHVVDGCAYVNRALERAQAGEPYGPIRGDKNGYWEWFDTLQEAEAAQRATRKATQDRCRLGPCRDRFPR